MSADRKRRSEEIRFVVRYPWGSNYCHKLRAALRRLGVPTMDDAFNDGSDNDGFFVSAHRARFAAARRLIREYDRYLAGGGANRFDDVMAALWEGGVYEIMQDWKHLVWEPDAVTLARLGVRLKMVAERETGTYVELTFSVSPLAPSRRQPLRR